MSEEAVKVAVRVRPFNSREIDRNCKLVVAMQNASTSIFDPSGRQEPRTFTFDYSYWSFDGHEPSEGGELRPAPRDKALPEGGNTQPRYAPHLPTSFRPPLYADQKTVYSDLGKTMLKCAFEGFNASLFAYGQTGSGKSFSTVGYGTNRGLLPLLQEDVFARVAADSAADSRVRFTVFISMYEIYMEEVMDLLDEGGRRPRGGLKVRENVREGSFFVEGLQQLPVASLQEMAALIDRGTNNRTLAATNMNATSSRAHTVIGIRVERASVAEGGVRMARASTINLIDLAGSERQQATGNTGTRLKEGVKINLSLSTLGNVIAALAEKAPRVPYRDSVLTQLLKNALGGNSKTIMLAAISPADINYEESLSTLRYADRAKQIKTVARVNENATDRLLQDLQQENERLRAMLAGMQPLMRQTSSMTPEDSAAMRKQIEEEVRAQLLANEARQAMLDPAALQEKAALVKKAMESAKHANADKEKKLGTTPRITNLNEDPQFSGVVVHFIEEGETAVGSARSKAAIVLEGASIEAKHAVFQRSGFAVSVTPVSPRAVVVVNGRRIQATQRLSHLDRVVFGTIHVYVFRDPRSDRGHDVGSVDWASAQREIAAAKGYDEAAKKNLKIDDDNQELITQLLPRVAEANSVCEALHHSRRFELAVLAGPVAGLEDGESRIMVKLLNNETGNRWMLTPDRFTSGLLLLQEYYIQHSGENADAVSRLSDSSFEDPFIMDPDDVVVGTATVFLKPLAYGLEYEDSVKIVDYKGRGEGQLTIALLPCDRDGVPLAPGLMHVENPADLLGKPYNFKLAIISAQLRQPKFAAGVSIGYVHRYLHGGVEVRTKTIGGTMTPIFNEFHLFQCPALQREQLDWFQNSSVTFKMYGRQSDQSSDASIVKLDGEKIRKHQKALNHVPTLTYDMHRALAEKNALARQLKDMMAREERIKQMLADGQQHPEATLKALRAMLAQEPPPRSAISRTQSERVSSGACVVS